MNLIPSSDDQNSRETEWPDSLTIALEAVDQPGSPDAANQEAMFALRTMIAKSPSGQDIAWLPQAIEGLFRAQRSDFVAAFGHVRGLQIDRNMQRVRLLTQGEQNGVFEMTFDQLKPYSLELQLQELEGGETIDPIHYSPEMTDAIALLPESARYRWDLITRAARCAAAGKTQTKDGTIRVGPVAPDLLSYAHGVGVFLDRQPRSAFSIMKVTRNEVPLTEKERTLESLIHGTSTINSMPDDLKNHVNGLMDLMHWLEKKYPHLKPGYGSGAIHAVMQGLKTAQVSLLRSKDEYGIHQVLKAYVESRIGTTFGVADVGLKDFYTAKGTYRDERPFEFTPEDSTDGLESVRKNYEDLGAKLAMISSLIQKHAPAVKSCIPKDLDPRFYDAERMQRVQGVLEGAPKLENLQKKLLE